jgi:hypothetical protein
MSQTFLRDLNYKIQLEQMTLNQWGETKPREQNRKFELPSVDDLLNNKSETQNKQQARQEQIQLYLEKEKRPVIVNGQQFKYNSIPEPNLNEFTQYTDTIKDLKDDIDYLENGINKKLQEIQQARDNIKLIDENIEKLNSEQNKRGYFLSNSYINKLSDLQKMKQDYILEENEEISKLETTRNTTPKDRREKREIYEDKIELIREAFSKNQTKVDNEIQDLEDEKNKIVSELSQIKKDLQKFVNDKLNENLILRNLENEIKLIEGTINIKEDQINDQNVLIKEAQKENKIRSEDYSNELRRLNFGSFNVEKLYNETDEEYVERLTKNAQLPFDNSTYKNLSDIERNNQFKDNLKQLFESDSYIEQVLNYFKMNNDHFIFIFNQYFNLFKDDYLKIYGYNNKALIEDSEQLIELINNFCEADVNGSPSLVTPLQDIEQKKITSFLQPISRKIEELKPSSYLTDLSYEEKLIERQRLLSDPSSNPQEIKAVEASVAQLEGPMKTLDSYNPEILDNNTVMKFTNPSTGEVKFLKYLIIEPTTIRLPKSDGKKAKLTKKPPTLLISDSGQVGSFTELSNNDFVVFLKGYFALTDDEIKKILNVDKLYKLSGEKIMTFFKIYKLGPAAATITDIKLLDDNKNLIGMGISNDLPDYIKFGKYTLLYKKLILKNILSLQKNNSQKIAGFKNYNVSDQFVNLIKKLLKKESLTPYDINTLKINEKELLDNLLTLCELNKNIITGSGAETLKKIKDQLAVIEGQIESGNNNPIVKDELYKTLFKLVNFGSITEREARKHYKQICNDFF